MATQSRGAPYPLGTDPNNTAADIQALSLWVNDRPGVAALTTTQRNALTGVDRWDGKLVLDTTLDRLFRWDAGTTTWIQIADSSEIAALLATSGTPADLGTAASRGVSSSAARADHVHKHPSAGTSARLTSTAATALAPTTTTVVTLAGRSYEQAAGLAVGNTYVAPRAGLVDVRGRASVISGGVGERFFAAIWVNGVEVSRGADTDHSGGGIVGVPVADVLDVPAGAIIDLRVYNAAAAARNTETGTGGAYLTCRMV